MKILSMKTSLSSSQKPNKFALQPIKACKRNVADFVPDRFRSTNKNDSSRPKQISLRSLRQVATLRHGHMARRSAPAFRALWVCEHS